MRRSRILILLSTVAAGCGEPGVSPDLEHARALSRSELIVDTHIDLPYRLYRRHEDVADEVIVVSPPVSGSVSMTSGSANRFSYDSRGFGTAAADTISFCDDRSGETGRVIRVNAAGRIMEWQEDFEEAEIHHDQAMTRH